MLVKILIIAVFIILVMYVVLPKRRVPTTYGTPPRRTGRLALTLLASAAMLLFILALFCLLLWVAGATEVITGGGEVLSGTGLLRISGVLLVLSIVCAFAAWIKRPR